MNSEQLFYLSGEVVHAGDRIQYDTIYGTVVFVNHGDSEESLPGYEDNTGADPGVVICDDDGETTAVGYPSERLTFIERA
jgi:hypothetical protein